MAKRAINAIIANQPGHTESVRPIHAPGIGVTGKFQASDVASRFSGAAHFSGRPVPVTVRFSDGTGSLDEPDTAHLVRGMAIRFHLSRMEADSHDQAGDAGDPDMICMTLPVFFTRTVADFIEFMKSVKSGKVPKRSQWRALANAVKLNPPPTRPLSAREYGAIAYAHDHLEARPSVVALTGLSVPQSYATSAYHAVHAYRLRAGDDNVTAVRFRWEPIAGVRSAPEGTKSPFLKRELGERLGRGPVGFVLRMQVAEQGDDTSDPTRAWPEGRRRVVMGHLLIEEVAKDQEAQNEQMRFDPTRVVPGIELSDDDILCSRRAVYKQSAEDRLKPSPR